MNTHLVSVITKTFTAVCACVYIYTADQPAYAESTDDLDKDRWDNIEVSGGDVSTQSKALTWNENIPETSSNTSDDEDEADPHHGYKTWLSPSPQKQRERNAQLPSMMKGGIFVPAMTMGMVEPRYQVFKEDTKIDESMTGMTSYVDPGDYTVVVGTPVTKEMMEFDVHVVEGSVTTVPVEWSGLVVKVVNDHGATIHGNYEIVSLPDRSYIGLGSGALINEGERLNTWLLWPGKYMIISAGEGYQARKNFITISLAPGELSRVTLVLDEDTGDLLGGGEIETREVDDEDRWWWAGVLIGGSIRFNRTDDVVGKATGQTLDISAFIESYFTLGLAKHFLYTRLNAEIGGALRFEDRPFITTVDELNLEILYTYRVVDWFGPYARFSFDSNMAPAYQEFTSPYTVVYRNSDQEVTSTETGKTDIRLSPSFSPIRLNAGAGGRFDLTIGTWFTSSARIGAAYRHVFTRDLYVLFENELDDHIVTLDRVDSNAQIGFEAALSLDMTPIQWFTLKVDASLLEPFNHWKSPIFDLDVDAAFRLSSIASISYTLRLDYDPQLIDKVQLDQYIQLRFSYKVL